MSSEPEPGSEVRPAPAPPQLDTTRGGSSTPLLIDDGARSLTRVLVATVLALVLGLIAYETFMAPPKDDRLVWTPPAGLSAADTPEWLQALCADRTRELCRAADRARTAADCDAMRAALRSLDAVDRTLSARGQVSAQQHWVLVELYGQGHELCQFERAGQPTRAAR